MPSNPPSYEMATLSVSQSDPDDKQVGLDNPSYETRGSHTAESGVDIQLGVAQPVRPAYESQAAVWHTGQNTTVVVNQPHLAARPAPVQMIHGSGPTPTVCFNCGESIVTYIYYEVGACTYASCFLLACVGCDLGCCLLPFCIDYFKDATHKCPKCHVILGKHKRI